MLFKVNWDDGKGQLSYEPLFLCYKTSSLVGITHFIQAVFKTFINIIIHHYRHHVIRKNKSIKTD
jgi:hypothetical protein